MPPSPPVCRVGQRVGSYILRKFIHSGGAGEVWVGENAVMKRYRAVKVVPSASAFNQSELDGLGAYSDLAQAHPGLVPIYEFDYLQGIGYFYTMPLADHVSSEPFTPFRLTQDYEPLTLSAYRALHHPLPIDRMLGVAFDVLPALQSLHDRGFVHRDIKPGNIIRVRGRWMLCDIGLVQRRDRITHPAVLGGNPGTPWFIPPEGNSHRGADIFAFGRTMYLLVTEGNPTLVDDFRSGKVTIPGTDDRREPLREIISRACDPSVGSRYQNVADLTKDLLPLLRRTPITLISQGTLDNCTPEFVARIVEVLRAADIRVDALPLVSAGSIRLTFDLLPDSAQRLEALAQRRELVEFGVERVEWAGSTVTVSAARLDDPPPEHSALSVSREQEPAERVGESDWGRSPSHEELLTGYGSEPADVRSPPAEVRGHPGARQTESTLSQDPDRRGRGEHPKRLGHYELGRVLGVGGMGTVYESFDLNLRRHVAVKVIRPEYASFPEARARFKREVQLASLAYNPGVVPVFDYGEDQDTAFFVMPVLSGESLQTRLERNYGRLPFETVVRYGVSLARVLGSLHGKGIVHRDVKPLNVWIDADTDQLQLFDFGIAKLIGSTDLGDLVDQITQPGQAIGTRNYMPPEQFQGALPGPRNDLFSLGAVLYRCLTGAPPINAPEFLPLPHERLTTVLRRAGAPEPFCDLVTDLLSREPDRRPHSASVVIARLSAITSGTQIEGLRA